jgi:hypothetical protein
LVIQAPTVHPLGLCSSADTGPELGHKVPGGVVWSMPIDPSSVVDRAYVPKALPQGVVSDLIQDEGPVAEGVSPKLHLKLVKREI